MIRATLRPLAECQHVDCGWRMQGDRWTQPRTVRSQAEHHVLEKGHIVNVTISDITAYSPE